MLEQALLSLYQPLAQGLDIAPAALLKLEGKIDYWLENGDMSWQQCQEQVEQSYQAAFKQAVPEVFWQWCLDDGVFRLPYKMLIAPVK